MKSFKKPNEKMNEKIRNNINKAVDDYIIEQEILLLDHKINILTVIEIDLKESKDRL